MNFIQNQISIKTIKEVNLRNAPSVSSGVLVGTAPKDTLLKSIGWVTDGEGVNGNTKWFKIEDGRFIWAGNVVVIEGLQEKAKEIISEAISFVLKQPNLVDSPLTLKVREIIGDVLNGGRNKLSLQCTEYVSYKVKTKLGLDIKWPVTSGRNGGKWGTLLERVYQVSNEPTVHSAMSFTSGISKDPEINEIGHVAFVEEVMGDGSIRISEANWPRDGIYSERTISKKDYTERYKARFVKFA